MPRLWAMASRANDLSAMGISMSVPPRSPAELFNEERLEIKIFQMLFDVVENSGHVAIRG